MSATPTGTIQERLAMEVTPVFGFRVFNPEPADRLVELRRDFHREALLDRAGGCWAHHLSPLSAISSVGGPAAH